MCNHVDLAEAWRRAVPIVERADRNLAPDCRVEAAASPLAAARLKLNIPERAIDGCGADRENKITIPHAKLQSAMPLKCRQQCRDHHLEPLAAYRIRCFPQRCQRILDGRAVHAAALLWRMGSVRRLVLTERTYRMLAVPARHRAQLVEDTPLFCPPGRPVALRHRRYHPAPRAHAEFSAIGDTDPIR